MSWQYIYFFCPFHTGIFQYRIPVFPKILYREMSENCRFCSLIVETADHLLLHCTAFGQFTIDQGTETSLNWIQMKTYPFEDLKPVYFTRCKSSNFDGWASIWSAHLNKFTTIPKNIETPVFTKTRYRPTASLPAGSISPLVNRLLHYPDVRLKSRFPRVAFKAF